MTDNVDEGHTGGLYGIDGGIWVAGTLINNEWGNQPFEAGLRESVEFEVEAEKRSGLQRCAAVCCQHTVDQGQPKSGARPGQHNEHVKKFIGYCITER